MINKTALALVAALIAASTSMANADDARDINTGLRTEIYYAPLAQLQREGVPISARARAYLKRHPEADVAMRYRDIDSLRYRGGYNARAQAPGYGTGSGIASYNPYQCTLHYGSDGAPVGPYC